MLRKALSLSCLILLLLLNSSCENTSAPGGTAEQAFWSYVGPDSLSTTTVAVHPNGAIFAGVVNSSRKLIESTNDGESWTTISLPITGSSDYVKTLTITYLGKIFCSTSNGMTSQLLASGDMGMSWQTLAVTGDIVSSASDLNTGVYVGTSYHDESSGSIQYSRDGGASWVKANVPDTIGVYLLYVTGSGAVLASGGAGVTRRSSDQGQTWTQISIGTQGLPLWTLTSNFNGTLYAFLGSDPARLFRSSDDGITWDSVGFIQSTIENFAIDNRNRFYATTGYFERKGIFYSTDGGSTWNTKNDGLDTSLWIRSMMVTPAGYLYLATEKGLYRSSKPSSS